LDKAFTFGKLWVMVDQEASWKTHNYQLINCRLCPRLVNWREDVARKRKRAYNNWEYWGKPILGFGDRESRVLIVGLAPAAHGGNRTGRIFTGDSSADFLMKALYRAGFANQPTSNHKKDGLELRDAFISAVCRCAPPDNKPTIQELDNCRPYLEHEFELLENVKIVVALGQIAFNGVLRVLRSRGYPFHKLKFAHSAIYVVQGAPALIASYHPSRQNTQTGRLTESMFDEVWEKVKIVLTLDPSYRSIS
jgi:uracil-DNA glycosylase